MPHHWPYHRSAHWDCNLKLRVNPKDLKLPVISHNLCGYDPHFIMQEIGAIGKEHDLEINCIPNNMEKYVAFMLGRHLVFMDSFQFTAGSLEQLADNLPADKFKYTCQVFQDEELALMKNKGVYRYDYMDRSLVTNSCLLRIVSQSLKYVITGNTS